MTTFLPLDQSSSDHWSAHARQWSRIGSPLRPHADDVQLMRDLLHGHLPQPLTSQGLLLGVTPELCPLGYGMISIDRDSGMLEMARGETADLFAKSPGAVAGRSAALPLQGNWLALPLARSSIDFALGDGSFNLLRYPMDYHRLFEQLRWVLKPAAPLIVRTFTTPSRRETCAAVIAAAYAGQITSFHAFKWRFAMALVARNRNPNICVADIYREFDAWAPDRQALAISAGWPVDAIDTIDVYRNSPAVYSFPTAEEWAVLAARHSEEIQREHGCYELADRCPIVLARLRP